MIAIVVSFLGIVLMSYGRASGEDPVVQQDGWGYLLGIFCAVFTAFGVAIMSIITRKLKEVETSSLLLGHSIVGWVIYSAVILLV